ncbi:SDR family oxidoreductase [Planotetraspora phitsanulokensis]|uniref:Short-chain dehydrogenase n=1 Tax=Planotetraspora phitsanulokensis TaxID=575192 RepID=A0A8J3UG01_9ACTN|nr:SDR family oxidoreductase [Planotetraspora phitsanulokensis]GII38265.1 short-chain dehydrogenase [Planotetraspora phitsanulokensis]
MAKTAIVTGGSSGIGRALAVELLRLGVDVTIADIADADSTARELGCAGARLDVTDAAAVEDLVRGVKADRGRLDFLFNNAGIVVAGRTDELTLDHWNRMIDVNLRGVVHGVHAAYPIMVEQGYGYIVNTASLAGLIPAPLMLPYTTTKHAVVGLTLALRVEAAAHGVKVSAICPGFVDTPLLDHANPGLPQTEIGRLAKTIGARVQKRLYPPDAVARDVIRGMERGRALIVMPSFARRAWSLVRLSPDLAVRVTRQAARRALP